MTSVLTPILRRIDANAPHVDIGLLHLMPEQGRGSRDQPWQGSLEKLERRQIDIALLPLRVVPPRFEARRLFEEDFVVASAAHMSAFGGKADMTFALRNVRTEADLPGARHRGARRHGRQGC
jgi:DNA-binding transcriptional LysR family regulator